ncbi:unnamed protein product [Pleuronectes platessa]|uniref:Whirlin n=1 Tax=Pleuronectes platessa TaxID=8262 RepID=A0A9N7UFS0_PLEPL|nr:unnamed protein product [Pleuronectes platessa]
MKHLRSESRGFDASPCHSSSCRGNTSLSEALSAEWIKRSVVAFLQEPGPGLISPVTQSALHSRDGALKTALHRGCSVCYPPLSYSRERPANSPFGDFYFQLCIYAAHKEEEEGGGGGGRKEGGLSSSSSSSSYSSPSSSSSSSSSFSSVHLVLKGSKKLCLSVRSVGRIPGGYVTNHVYTWVDPQGRGVSPPPDLLEHRSATLKRNDSQRRSNMQLLQEGDEKKVNLVLDDGRSLGLMIRGGAEYALGIYITGVDQASAAQCGGLKVNFETLEAGTRADAPVLRLVTLNSPVRRLALIF